MKKNVKIFLILLLILGFQVNVYALDTQDSEPTLGEKSNDANLNSFTVNSQTGLCDNSTNVCKLEITGNNISNVKITYNLSSSKAKIIEGSNEVTIKNGENRFFVKVQAEDGETTKDYTIIINKSSLSTDATLKKLTINGVAISLKDDTRYSTTVSYATKKLDVEAVPNSDKAVVENANNNRLTYDFFEDKKEIRIKVTSEAGDIITYVITVTKRAEEDATLRSLKIENYDIDFSKDVTTYEITVLKNVDTLDITATPTDTDADVKIDAPEKLEIGENTITITVTNDGNSKTYVIKVKKLDEEDKALANLKSLKIDGYKLDFKEDKYEYKLKIGDVNYLDIDYETKNPDATVLVTGNMDLENGSIVKIRVTYTSGLTNVYRINIIKDEVETKKNNVPKIVIIIAIIAIIIAAIVVFIIQFKNKNNKDDSKKKDEKNKNKINEKKEELTEEEKNKPNPSDVVQIENLEDEDEII